MLGTISSGFIFLYMLQEQATTFKNFRVSTLLGWLEATFQKGLEVCYCLWGVPSRPSPGSYGPSRSHPGSEVVPSRFAMSFVLQCFGPIQVPRCGPSRPVLVPSCSRTFLTTGRNRLLGHFRTLKITKRNRGIPTRIPLFRFCNKTAGVSDLDAEGKSLNRKT